MKGDHHSRSNAGRSPGPLGRVATDRSRRPIAGDPRRDGRGVVGDHGRDPPVHSLSRSLSPDARIYEHHHQVIENVTGLSQTIWPASCLYQRVVTKP